MNFYDSRDSRPSGFIDWLRHAVCDDCAAGDLVEDLKRDWKARQNPDMRAINSAEQLTNYLRRNSACSGAINAAPVVFGRYTRWKARQRWRLP